MDSHEDIPMADFNVVCETDGCVNEGVVLLVPAMKNGPMVTCGPCGVDITNITPA